MLILFFNKADPFSRVCLFCNFVRNRIYVLKIEVLEPVIIKPSKVGSHYNCYKLIPKGRVYVKKDMQSLIHAMSLFHFYKYCVHNSFMLPKY